MKKYEAVFILDIRKIEDEGNAFSEELVKLITELGGNVVEKISMGRKQFAREIGKRKAGVYWNVIFELDAADISQVKEKYKLDERVLRVLIINYDRPAEVESKQLETDTVEE